MEISVVKTKDINPNVKPFLVDVPVKTNIWIRPDCQRRQFEVIRRARPSILILQSDGGRNEKEWKLIRENRNIFDEEIDWDCTVHKIYADKNYGMYQMGEILNKYLWSVVDRCIFLEDDHIPSVSFFKFCKEMLCRYEDDLRINAICGMNHLGIYDSPNADYFFSRVGSIWGIAMWKRTYDLFRLDYAGDDYTIDEVCKNEKKDTFFCESMRGYAEGKKVGGHVPAAEFYLVLNTYTQNQLYIIPKKNMISCVGAAPGSTHAVSDVKKLAKGDAQIFNMKTYELEGEIKHPNYVFPDMTYEKKQKRIIAWHHPIISHYRRIVSIIKRVRYGEGKILAWKAINKMKRLGKPEEEK